VSLVVYDSVGREIETVVSESLPAGNFEYEWEAGRLPSGVYFYRMTTSDYTRTGEMLLFR
jgi:hypothetical protein